jgi:hypothetical protein
VRRLELLLAVWTVLWVGVGVLVWHEVRGLRPLADTVAVAGASLDDTASVLRGVSDVPFVGGRLRRVAADASRTAASARESAREGRRSVDHLALILGIAVAAVAVLPVGAAYALLRVRR